MTPQQTLQKAIEIARPVNAILLRYPFYSEYIQFKRTTYSKNGKKRQYYLITIAEYLAANMPEEK